MNYEINLNEVDVDGAVREAAREVSGDTRLSFLRKAGVAGGAVMGGGASSGARARCVRGRRERASPGVVRQW